MENIQPKTPIWHKIRKYLIYGFLTIILLIFVSQLVWKMSGSNQWEFVADKEGVKIYTLKSPGSDILKVKGITRVKSTLSGLVAISQDQTTCDECLKAEVIEQVSDRLSYVTFAFPFPYYFEPREFVVQSLYSQNPISKEVVFDFTSAPGKLAPDDKFFRVTHFYVFWKFTPVGNGEVELEMIRDIDPGGFAPAIMINNYMPYEAWELLSSVQEAVAKDKYQTAQVSFIDEPSLDQRNAVSD
jgi:hypothetical protein